MLLPAHVEVSLLLLQHLPHSAAVLPQPVLHVHLLVLVSGEGQAKLREHAALPVAVQLLLVDEVLFPVPAAKVQHRVAKGFVCIVVQGIERRY